MTVEEKKELMETLEMMTINMNEFQKTQMKLINDITGLRKEINALKRSRDRKPYKGDIIN